MTQQNLFETEVSISPMKAFIKKHKIKTFRDCNGKWRAMIPMPEYVEFWSQKYSSEMDAIFELAKNWELDGWKELNWD